MTNEERRIGLESKRVKALEEIAEALTEIAAVGLTIIVDSGTEKAIESIGREIGSLAANGIPVNLP